MSRYHILRKLFQWRWYLRELANGASEVKIIQIEKRSINCDSWGRKVFKIPATSTPALSIPTNFLSIRSSNSGEKLPKVANLANQVEENNELGSRKHFPTSIINFWWKKFLQKLQSKWKFVYDAENFADKSATCFFNKIECTRWASSEIALD